MEIGLYTDVSKHNLALMKISAWHGENGDNVYLNYAGFFDKTYGSWLYDWTDKNICDIEGGTGIDPTITLDPKFEEMKPHYGLFNLDYSLGYTWKYCPRRRPFCIVHKQNNPKTHHSIWEFHDPKFNTICLLNNNTFSDPQWKETFEEIWDADLTLIEHGFDVRLMTEEKADALKKTKIRGQIHYAWDLMEYENQVLKGLKIAPTGLVYVLVGYNTTFEEDMYRCEMIHHVKTVNRHRPYIMVYDRSKPELIDFKNFIERRFYWKYNTFDEAWKDYRGRLIYHKQSQLTF